MVITICPTDLELDRTLVAPTYWVPGATPFPPVTTRIISRHCQMLAGGIVVTVKVSSLIENHCSNVRLLLGTSSLTPCPLWLFLSAFFLLFLPGLIKKAEQRGTDVFKLWGWRRLL